MSSNIKKNLNSYAIIYPNKIKEFIKNQEDLFKTKDNYELAFVGRTLLKYIMFFKKNYNDGLLSMY